MTKVYGVRIAGFEYGYTESLYSSIEEAEKHVAYLKEIKEAAYGRMSEDYYWDNAHDAQTGELDEHNNYIFKEEYGGFSKAEWEQAQHFSHRDDDEYYSIEEFEVKDIFKVE